MRSKKVLFSGAMAIGITAIAPAIYALPPKEAPSQHQSVVEAEAISYIGIINHTQMAHYLEKGEFSPTLEQLVLIFPHDGEFSPTLEQLVLMFPHETEQYSYSVVPLETSPHPAVGFIGQARIEGIRSYASVTFLHVEGGRQSLDSLLCETIEPSTVAPALPRVSETDSTYECSEGSTVVRDES